jgi:hypothetical protein
MSGELKTFSITLTIAATTASARKRPIDLLQLPAVASPNFFDQLLRHTEFFHCAVYANSNVTASGHLVVHMARDLSIRYVIAASTLASKYNFNFSFLR